MMTSHRPSALLLCVALGALSAPAAAQDGALTGKQIADRMVEQHGALGVKAGQADLKLTIKGRGDDGARVRALRVRAKEIGARGHTLVKLTAPKEVAGQAFLFVENEGAPNDIWTYTPAFKHTQRMKSSERRKEFLGTHFTFSDLEQSDFKGPAITRLKDASVGKIPVYVIESTPAADSAYGKVRAYVRQRDFAPLKIKFYKKDGEALAKTVFVEKFETHQGKASIKQMTVRAESGGYTTLLIESVDTAVDLPDAMFSSERMGD